jgi:hypothetical protein
MTNEFKVLETTVFSTIDKLSDVIYTATWLYGDSESDFIGGEVTFSEPNLENFLPIESITEEILNSWALEALGGIEVLEAELQKENEVKKPYFASFHDGKLTNVVDLPKEDIVIHHGPAPDADLS